MKQILFIYFLSLTSVLLFGQKIVTRPLCTFTGHKGIVKSLSIDAKGEILMSGGDDKTVKFWNIATSSGISSTNVSESVGDVAISADASLFAYTPVIISKDAQAQKPQKPGVVGKMADKSEALVLGSDAAIMQAITFSSNGKYLATGDRLGVVRIFDAQTFKEVAQYDGKNNFISALSFFGENDKYLAMGGDKSLRLWDYTNKEAKVVGMNIDGEFVSAIAASPDAKFVAYVGNEGKIDFLDCATEKKRKMPELGYELFAGATGKLTSIAYSKDGKLLAAAGIGGLVYVWQAQSGTPLVHFKGHEGYVNDIVFSPDNRYLFSAGADKTIKMWDVTDFTFTPKAMPIVKWEAQKWEKQMTNVITDSLQKTVGFSIHSFYPLSDIAFYQNGTRLNAEFKDVEGAKKLYNLKFTLAVRENTIRIEAKNEAGQAISEERLLIFNPPRAVITWQSPDNNSISKEESVRTLFCVKSIVPLKETKLYLNGTAIADESLVIVPSNGGGCDYTVSAMLKLNPGSDTVYLTTNNGDLLAQSEERILTYMPPAPTFTWITPTKDYTVKDTAINMNQSVNVELCINSLMPIKSYELKNEIGNTTADSRSIGVKKVEKVEKVENEKLFKGSCDNQYVATIPLHAGENIISLTVTTEFGAATSEKRIIKREVMKDTTKTAWTGTYYAVLIGENMYQDQSIQDLQNPAKDADSIANILTRLYSFDKKNVFVLKDASKMQILNQLVALVELIKPEDKLLVFYAGHGIQKGKLGYFLPSDANKTNFLTWISSDELFAIFKQINTQHTLLIADACYSGTFFMRSTSATDICETLEAKTSRRVITSGAAEEVPDQSIFIEYLLKSLKNEAESCIGSSKLFNSFKDNVTSNSPNHQIPQEGSLHDMGHEGGDFIFHKK